MHLDIKTKWLLDFFPPPHVSPLGKGLCPVCFILNFRQTMVTRAPLQMPVMPHVTRENILKSQYWTKTSGSASNLLNSILLTWKRAILHPKSTYMRTLSNSKISKKKGKEGKSRGGREQSKEEEKKNKLLIPRVGQSLPCWEEGGQKHSADASSSLEIATKNINPICYLF